MMPVNFGDLIGFLLMPATVVLAYLSAGRCWAADGLFYRISWILLAHACSTVFILNYAAWATYWNLYGLVSYSAVWAQVLSRGLNITNFFAAAGVCATVFACNALDRRG